MYLSYVHSFRGLAILGIVGAHCIHSLDWSSDQLAFRLFDTLFNQSSIWFFFIAGLLFQHLSGRFTPKSFYRTKLRNVITPYLILSVPALIVVLFFIPAPSVPPQIYDYPIAGQALLFLITGKHLAPFWFVPTISLIFLLAPLLLWLDKRPRAYLLLPFFLALSAWLGRGGLQGLLGEPLFAATPSKALYLFSVYWLGMCVSHYQAEAMQVFRRFEWLFWVLSLLFMMLNIGFYQQQHHWLFFFKLAAIPLLLVNLERFDTQVRDTFRTLGDLSFGIFFIHGYLLAAIKLVLPQLGYSSLLPGNLLVYLAMIAFISISCVFLLRLSQTVFETRSRMLVGC